MENTKLGRIEPLEQRIAPAALAISRFVDATEGSRLELRAGDMLSTGGAGGAYLLFVEKGSAIVFTTDLNNNDQIDFNEITGIAAGDGLRLISFVDIHGDIVTNLNPDGKTLTDSDNNASNGVDGRVLRDSRIEKIELRSLTQEDVPGTVLTDRLAFSTYSIFGSVYAGGGFGLGTDGLLIDTVGKTLQAGKFSGNANPTEFIDSIPTIGSIKVGTGASNELFSFGTSAPGQGAGFNGEDIQGELLPFQPASGKAGADIMNIRTFDPATPFNLGTLKAGDGGFNGRGGNISNIVISGDNAGGYSLIAGNGGDGPTGQAGGSIINYQDLGSITSQVILQSGDGGRGLTGLGGDAGSVDLVGDVPITLAGRIFVNLGDGGDGLTGGGAGGNQKTGAIGTPESQVPIALSLASSQHNSGDIFNTISDIAAGEAGYHAIRGFDFDLDGTNDVVYTTTEPNQLVVLFGAPGGGFDEQGNRYPGAPGTLYLDSPINAEALVVTDLNGDGFSDIAAASNNPSAAGVSVYLSRYTFDPATGEATFVGFRDPSFAALPSLTGGGGLYYQRPVRITAMTAGDYDHDGVMDLAINTIQRSIQGPEGNVLLVLRGDADPSQISDLNPAGATGRFFADSVNGGPLGYFTGLGGGEDSVYLRSSAVVDGGGDVLFSGVVGQKFISRFDFTAQVLTSQEIGLGAVDTNRDVSEEGKRDKISLEDATFRDFTIVDVESDGDADIFVLTDNPEGFLVALQADNVDGEVTYSIASNDVSDDTAERGGENAGIRLSERPPKGLDLATSLVGILTTAADDDGIANDITIVDYNVVSRLSAGFNEISFSGVEPGTIFNATLVGSDGASVSSAPLDSTILAFDTYRPSAGLELHDTTKVGYGVAWPVRGNRAADYVTVSDGTLLPLVDPPEPPEGEPVPPPPYVGTTLVSFANNGLFMRAGDGGDSANGRGGIGGQIGSKLISTGGVITGTFSIILPANLAYEPLVRLVSGNGGDGYSAGGAGGSVQGVTVNQAGGNNTVSSLLFAGNGGDSIKGTGGAGGNLDALSVLGGTTFIAGNGGRGVNGGAGGSVIGNKIEGLADTSNAETTILAVKGGNGGLGLKQGGAGGSITNFTPSFVGNSVTAGDVLYYAGGSGGNSLSGTGGRGGSVTNSSPLGEDNNLVADLIVLGGKGGNGATGGVGGDVTKFLNVQGGSFNPKGLTIMAGAGGTGSSGKGGNGGKVSDVDVVATGIGMQWAFDFTRPDQIEGFPGFPLFAATSFARYIGGEGGVSFGNAGGSGGNVENAKGTAVSTSIVAAAGKGGDGLTGGGVGGNVTNASLEAAATLGKVLVIAGDGGDVYGAEADSDLDPLAPGGTNGSGGNGGNINGIIQEPSGNTIVDLIAGNGGSTINFGTTLDGSTNVGRGGSISNVKLEGNIGDVKPASAIRSYNDLLSGERMADFVNNTLINDPSVNLLGEGNVGLVAGASGRVKDNNNDGILDPAPISAVNGSAINIVATNIMSAVAGSVDRIASIQVLTNVRTASISGSIFGADKIVDSDIDDPATVDIDESRVSNDGVLYTTRTDYLTAAGNHTRPLSGEAAPVIGGKLVDGAIVAKNERPLKSIRDFIRR